MRIWGVLGAAALAVSATASLAADVPPTIPIASFAALATFSHPVLSPNGDRIVAKALVNGESKLAIINADKATAAPMLIDLGKGRLEEIHWAGDNRLLLTLWTTAYADGFQIPILRLIAVDLPSGAARLVDPKSQGILAGDVLYTDPTGSWALVASQDDVFSEPSVKRVDLATGAAKVVERSRPDVWDWFADDQGVVRAGVAYDERHWTVWYRDTADEKLHAIRGKFDKADDDSSVDRITFGLGDQGTIVTNEKTGRFAAYVYDFRTGTIGAPIYENPNVDITDIEADPVTGKVDGVWYEDSRRHAVWLDPDLKTMQAQIDKALPNAQNDIVGLSKDRKRVLVWTGGASDPGAYYLLDRTTMRMHPVFEPYPAIDPATLAEVKPVIYQARDGLQIPAYLTLPRGREAKNLPLILLPHGGPFERDHWEYDPIVQFLANRGYAVLQPQFRGSTGYGKDFVAKGYGEWGRKMQDDLDDGVDWLVKSGEVDPKRVCILGLSYGGYAAMWGAIRNPERYRCAASMAGVSDLKAELRYDRKAFSATRYFREWQKKVGGEGNSDLGAVSPINFADRLKAPIFIAQGEDDDTVPASQGHSMVEALTKANANVTSIFYKGEGHGFDKPADFSDWLRRLEAFLAKYNPA